MQKQVFVTSVDEVHDEEKDNLGDLRWEGGKLYKYIKYNDGTGNLDGAAGDVVTYFDNGTAGAGYGNNEVTKDFSDGTDSFPAGVLVAAMTDGQFGWIQLKGFDTLSTAIESSNDATPVAAADSDVLVMGDADGTLRRQNTTIDADAERVPEIAIGVDVSAKEVLLDFPV